MTEAEWDAVIKVHLKGTFAPSRHAAAYWRERSKAGDEVDARIINTSSPSGIYGNPGQTNYGAAKAGIASFTIIAALELARYGVTVNAIAPAALTRMTENLGMGQARGGEGADVAALDRPDRHLAGERGGGRRHRPGVRRLRPVLAVAEGWHRGPSIDPVDDPDPRSARSSPSSSPPARPTPTWTASRAQLAPAGSPPEFTDTTARDRPHGTKETHAHQPRCRRLDGRPVRHSWTSKDACSTRSASVRGDSTSSQFTTENTNGVLQQVLPTMAVVLGPGVRRLRLDRLVQPGDARPRRAGDHAAPEIPVEGEVETTCRARSPASTTRARAPSW
jgi:hypothetical protein